jgi:DNA-binding HxlR family transcriptional regulator
MANNFESIINECPVQHTHQFIGGKWRVGILWSLKNETRRFGELKREVSGISEKMLIQELKHLQKLEIIDRKAYHEIPPKVEYSLTLRGKSLIPLIENIVDWGYSDMGNQIKTTANNL